MDIKRIAASVVAARVVARGSNGDILTEIGRSADLGQDEDSVQTHHDLEEDDLENVDTRPKQ